MRYHCGHLSTTAITIITVIMATPPAANPPAPEAPPPRHRYRRTYRSDADAGCRRMDIRLPPYEELTTPYEKYMWTHIDAHLNPHGVSVLLRKMLTSASSLFE